MNRRGEKPVDLQPDDQPKQQDGPVDLLAGDSITRFDKAKKKKKKKKPQPDAPKATAEAKPQKAEAPKKKQRQAQPKKDGGEEK